MGHEPTFTEPAPRPEPIDPEPTEAQAAVAAEEPEVELLSHPADGLPEVITDNSGLRTAAEQLAGGTGPIAIDAERASGYRYGQRAYLIQLRREGSGTVLIDPITITEFGPLVEALTGPEWVLHAASQDLPCLAELGLAPTSLFDTELAARIAGQPRVGLGPLVENILGLRLEKGHSAADWSTRPLPEPWLVYAALDVEVLVELRDRLEVELEEQGKAEWAREEFAAIVAAPPPPPRVDPWRRTSGINKIRRPRGLAMVRSLWLARDTVAQQRDISPGRILPDSAISAAALAAPSTKQALADLDEFKGRGARRYLDTWWRALDEARLMSETELPKNVRATDTPPPARSWPDRDPVAAARLSAARSAVSAIADEHHLPTENLLTPDTLRRVCWSPPSPDDEAAIAEALTSHGARAWQVALTATAIARAFERQRIRAAAEAALAPTPTATD